MLDISRKMAHLSSLRVHQYSNRTQCVLTISKWKRKKHIKIFLCHNFGICRYRKCVCTIKGNIYNRKTWHILCPLPLHNKKKTISAESIGSKKCVTLKIYIFQRFDKHSEAIIVHNGSMFRKNTLSLFSKSMFLIDGVA